MREPKAVRRADELARVDRLIAEIESGEDYAGRRRLLEHLRGRRETLEYCLQREKEENR